MVISTFIGKRYSLLLPYTPNFLVMQSYLFSLRTDVGQGKQEAVLTKLLDLASKGQSDYINEIILLENRLNTLRTRERQGLLSESQAYEKRQVNASLLQLIDEMEEDTEIQQYLEKRFQEVFAAAKEKFNAKDYQAALPLFEEAESIKAEPEIRLLIQACHKALGTSEVSPSKPASPKTPYSPAADESKTAPNRIPYFIVGGILLIILFSLLNPAVRNWLFGPSGKADLAVTAFQMHPKPAVKGQPIEVQFRVENLGLVPSEATHVQWWAESGTANPNCEKSVRSLQPGEKLEFNCRYAGYSQTSAGLVSEVILDPSRQLEETSTNNNSRQMQIKVVDAPVSSGGTTPGTGSGEADPDPDPPPSSKADLVITQFELSPNPPTQGEAVRVNIKVKNQGNKNAGSFRLEWWAGVNFPEAAFTKNVTSLAAGQSRTFQYTYAGYSSWYGRLATRVVVDPTSRVDEWREDNNQQEKVISVKKAETTPTPGTSGGVDLVAAAMQMHPDPPVQGQPVQVQIAVENRGNQASGSFKVEWWAGSNFPNPAYSTIIPRLEAGKRKVLSFRYDGYASWYGRLTTKMVVDPKNEVAESNTQNNVREKVISVRKPQ